jgi:GNAT superfamily N-acetyltransferase
MEGSSVWHSRLPFCTRLNITDMHLTIRPCTMDEAPILECLIERSVRSLQANDYTQLQMDGALGTVLGLDRQLIRDGTYLVAVRDGRIVGCGGWSHRRTLFGADAVATRDSASLIPGVDAAKIRAFFIEPDCARQGIGTAILHACEAAAASAGFTRFEMGATLTGIPLYARWGYTCHECLQVPLPNGETLAVVRMSKEISF